MSKHAKRGLVLFLLAPALFVAAGWLLAPRTQPREGIGAVLAVAGFISLVLAMIFIKIDQNETIERIRAARKLRQR